MSRPVARGNSVTADVTQWEAWERGVAAAKALPAPPLADVAKDREGKWEQILAPLLEKCSNEPVSFCPAPGCGLTVAPGHARCWVHRPVDRGDLEGRLG